MEYTVKHNLSTMHDNFNNECKNVKEDFKNNQLMRSIVQNCDYQHGQIHINYIKEKYGEIYDKIDFMLLKVYDLIGGQGLERLINGVSPKVISYIREAIFFYKTYLEPKNIKNIDTLMIIGGGYGMEAATIYHICEICGVKINKIIGIDMDNVAELQNLFFKEIQLDDVCKSYGPSYNAENISCVYSNCCLAELSPEINWNYYQNYINKSDGFFAVWGCWAADIPKYYEEYVCQDKTIQDIVNDGLSPNTNILLVK
jgi:hypothetical protein